MAVPSPSSPKPSSNLNLALATNAGLAFVGKLGVAGYMFAVKTEMGANSKAQSTDHYVQAGSFVNDNVVLPPTTMTVKGLVSETEIRRNAIVETATVIAKVVAGISYFTPILTNITKSIIKTVKIKDASKNTKQILSNAYNSTFDIYSVALNAFSFVTSNQSQVYTFFESLKTSFSIVSIMMPWHFYESAIITDIVPGSPQESDSWCSFYLSFKEYRAYDTEPIKTKLIATNVAEGIKNEVAQLKNNGKATGIGIKDNRSAALKYWQEGKTKLFGLG